MRDSHLTSRHLAAAGLTWCARDDAGTHGGSGGESFDENMFRLEKLETNFNSYGLIKLAIARNNTVLIATQTNQVDRPPILPLPLLLRAASQRAPRARLPRSASSYLACAASVCS